MAILDRLYYHEQFLLFFTHKLQWWRFLLCTISSGLYIATAVGRLRADWALTEAGFALMHFLNVLLVVLAIANRVIWAYLFHDPNALFRFRRPSKGYRRTVCALSFYSVLPSLLLHIPVFVLSSRTQRRRAGLEACRGQLVLYIALVCLFLWMVNRFLLGEDDEHYEPTIAVLPTDAAAARLSPYSDTAPDSHSASSISLLSSQPQLAPSGHLDAAYSRQPALGTTTCERIDDRHTSSSSAAQTRLDVEISSAVDATGETISSALGGNPTSRLRCPTVARFDYMPQGRVGPHSWPSLHIIPVVLGAVSTLIFILLCAFVHENRSARIPSS